MTHLKVQRVAFIKSLLHFLDCLHRAFVQYFEIPDAILGEKRARDSPMHPVQSTVSGERYRLVFASLPYIPCRKLKLQMRRCWERELTIRVENTIPKYRCHGITLVGT